MVMPGVAKLDCLMRVIREAEDQEQREAPVRPVFEHGIEERPTFALARIEQGGRVTRRIQRAITQR